MGIISVVLVFTLAGAVRAASIVLPKETVIVEDAQFADPTRSNNFGGNAYDRQANQIGLNEGQAANTALVLASPRALQHLVFNTQNPAIASLQPLSGNLLPVLGEAQGHTFISPSMSPSVILTPYVFSPILKTITFHTVTDLGGQSSGLSTSLASTHAKAAMNVWARQANIEFQGGPIISTAIPSHLGNPIIIAQSATPQELAIIAAANQTTLVNVFFLWQVSVAGVNVCGVTRPDVLTTYIYVSAKAPEALCPLIHHTIAHEIGHALGLPNIPATSAFKRYRLMFEDASGGFTITPAEASVAHEISP